MNNIYNLFSKYFDDIVFTKVQDNDQHSVFMCRVQSMLGTKFRYLVAIAPRDVYLVGTELKLSQIKWTCLQTRQVTQKYEYNLPVLRYKQKNQSPYNSVIQRFQKTNSESVYSCNEYPAITITLLSNSTDMYEYPERGSISAALETFQTIVEFKNN